jgi:hypothetical protein
MTTSAVQHESGLLDCLQEAFSGQSVRIVGHEQLKHDVRRLLVEVDGAERSVIAKSSDAMAARRCRLVAQRWLPALGLEDYGPPLLAMVADPGGEGAWAVYEDLRGHTLATDRPVNDELEAAIEAIARVHTAFAEHPLLPEFRLWGGDRGIHFYSANVRDAIVALRSLDLDRLGGNATAAREALLQRMDALKSEESERAEVLAALGGPETLVHGDLWPTNVLVLANRDAVHVRLIDWDEAGAGQVGFDLSTLLSRFDASDRGWILGIYRRAVERLAGWELPGDWQLNLIFETAAYARLASLLVWSVAAAEEGEPDWLPERLADMVDWLDAVRPVLPRQ